MGKTPCVEYFKEERNYEIGKWVTLKEGMDITFMAHGCMVQVAYDAADKLKKKGIDVRVINANSIKPVVKETIIKTAKEKKIITIEDHFIYGD